MARGVVFRGMLLGWHIELNERVDGLDGEVEAFARSVGMTLRPPDVPEVIATMPAGTRKAKAIASSPRISCG